MHRDLKPENLLYDNKDENATLKIIDFGTAKAYKEGQKFTKSLGSVQKFYILFFKSYYIAPEVLTKKYDYKCDIWSCGVILFILLSGYPPFNGKNNSEIIESVKEG